MFVLILTSCHGFCNILTIKRGGGHIVPPLECLRYSWEKIAYRIGSNSNSKFTNICCGHFDTILRSIGCSVKFRWPSAQIGRQKLIFPKIGPNDLFCLEIIYLNHRSRRRKSPQSDFNMGIRLIFLG